MNMHFSRCQFFSFAYRWRNPRGYAATIALILLSCVLANAAAAGSEALAQTIYQSFSGDVNGDGRPDILLKAQPKGMLFPVGDGVDAFISIPPASPSFVLLSGASGGYQLVASPEAAVLQYSAWVADTHELVFGKDGATGLRIKARAQNTSGFLVAMSADGKLELVQEFPLPGSGVDTAASQAAFERLLPAPVPRSATRTSAFEYDAATGLLIKEIIEPDHPQLRLETAYRYDAWGNRTAVTVSSPASGTAAIPTTVSSATFDALGRFPIASANALGHTETRTFDPKTGLQTSLTGPNQLTTRWHYDSFGRKTREIRADGTQTRSDYIYCSGVNGGSAACPAFAKYMITVTPLAADGMTANGPWTKRYFDSLDRQIRSETLGFDGAAIVSADTDHDQLGRVYRTSRPYFAGETIHWTVFTYDALGRIVATTLPDNSRTTLNFNALITSSTNALNQTRTRIVNSQGQPEQIVDALGNSLAYRHDPFGNLIRTTDPNGNVIVNRYDLRGRKETTGDAGMGVWNYQYDALSRLVIQTDAKGQVTTNSYDSLGRLTRRAEPDLLTQWTYDACARAVGKLCRVETSTGYAMTSRYDNYGRAEATTTTIDTAYTAGVTYDAHGRIATRTYPTGFAVRYGYSSLGYLLEVRNSAGNAVFWSGQSQDAEGHVLLQTYGNQLTTQQVFDGTTGRLRTQFSAAGAAQNAAYDYDAIGNLVGRSDASLGLNERFEYDGLNRLTSARIVTGSVGQTTQSYAYDSIGNITGRSGVGSYIYGAANSRPHALAELVESGGGRRKYEYDANGNLTRETRVDASGKVIPGKGRAAIHTSFNMPQTLSAARTELSFQYGPEHQRIKQVSAGGTTIYLHPDNQGSLFYEKEIKPDGRIEHEHFISAGGQVVAVVKQSGSSTTVRYFHRDQLGSTTAVSDESGKVIERLAYEAFGKRRHPNGAIDIDGALSGANTYRGYTNHEHLDELGLIHMNGRVYDPLTARFLSADPNVQAADNLQSYNRYSYVWNNPLNATDPTGYFKLDSWLKASALAFVAPTPRNLFNGIRSQPGQQYLDRALMKYPALQAVGQITAAFYGGPWAAAGFSAYMAGLNGGGTAGMLRAGAISLGSAAAFEAVGDMSASGSVENVAGHAAVGCASAVASGGNCGAGAMSAALPAAVGPVDGFGKAGNVVAQAMIGGAASVAGGGSFSNGAVTGAFGYLFNELLHLGDRVGAMSRSGYGGVASEGDFPVTWKSNYPATIPVNGGAADALQCTANCVGSDIYSTGGREQTGHSKGSHHYPGEAVDFRPLSVQPSKVFSCSANCGFEAGWFENWGNPHWHFQLRPGNGVPRITPEPVIKRSSMKGP